MASLTWRLRARSADLAGSSLRCSSVRSRSVRAVSVADLGDGCHVDGVVELPVAALGQAVNLRVSGGRLDRGRCRWAANRSRQSGTCPSCRFPDDGGDMIGPTPKMSVVFVCSAATMLRRRARTSLSGGRVVGGPRLNRRPARGVRCRLSSGWIVFKYGDRLWREISPANPPDQLA